MLKKYILTVVLFLFIVSPILSFAFSITKIENLPIKDSFQLSPTKIEFGMSEGDTATGTIKILNESADSSDFFIELEDRDGQISFSKNSIVDKDNLTLRHGEQAEVTLTVSVPNNTDKKDFSGVVFVSSQKTEDAKNAGGNKILARTGTIVSVKYIDNNKNIQPAKEKDDGKNSSLSDYKYLILFVLLLSVFFFLKWKRK